MTVSNVIAPLLVGCGALVIAGAALAQSPGYPDRPVKIIVPFAAAGPTDVVARLIAQKLSDKFGQQFYIENVAVPLPGRRATATPSCSCHRATPSTRAFTPSRLTIPTRTSRR